MTFFLKLFLLGFFILNFESCALTPKKSSPALIKEIQNFELAGLWKSSGQSLLQIDEDGRIIYKINSAERESCARSLTPSPPMFGDCSSVYYQAGYLTSLDDDTLHIDIGPFNQNWKIYEYPRKKIDAENKKSVTMNVYEIDFIREEIKPK